MLELTLKYRERMTSKKRYKSEGLEVEMNLRPEIIANSHFRLQISGKNQPYKVSSF